MSATQHRDAHDEVRVNKNGFGIWGGSIYEIRLGWKHEKYEYK